MCKRFGSKILTQNRSFNCEKLFALNFKKNLNFYYFIEFFIVIILTENFFIIHFKMNYNFSNEFFP